MNSFKYQLKILVNEKSMIFWTFIFPIILATLFNLAFSNLNKSMEFKVVDVAIVEVVEDNNFKSYIDGITQDTENKLLNVSYTNEEEAKQLLDDKKISGYYLVNDKIELVVNANGISQSILKAVSDKYYQTYNVITNISKENNKVSINEIISNVSFDTNNFSYANSSEVDFTVIYFYSLIGMSCLYACFWGLKVVTMNEANLSYQGARINISPTSKLKNLSMGMFISFITHYINMLLLFAYLVFVLNINFGSQTNSILLVMALGTFVGISLGSLVGNAFKISENAKISILVSITMALSFLSGMMIIDIKYLIQENVPFLAYINPVSLITDSLYALYYSNADRFDFNVICLIIVGVVISVISFIMMRGKKYDSI